MKTIHNSDIRFELNPRIIYVSDFEMTFYTVNRGEYYFKKTDADVIEAEVSGDTKYYLDLDWSMLEYVGQGVLNYQCVNNIADPSFPDGEYNQLIEKTTDYFIDTFTVDPEGDESIAERLEKEEEERKEADAVISGAVDTEIERATSAETALQEAIDAEESARTQADEALNNAITAETSARALADEALSQAIVDEASARTAADETLNNAITAETSARTAADEALSGAVDTKLQDYYLKSETSGKTEIQTALDGKSDTGHTHDERYYRKDETSGATELEAALNRKLDASAYTPTDLSNYYTKDQTSGKSEIASAISDLSGAVDTALLGYVNDAAYVSTAKTINLLNGTTVIASIDATPFIKDGMVDNVVISGNSLVITFNTDSGKEAISIPLTDIFDPAIYYTKTEIDGIVSGKANSSDVYLKTETSGKTEIATALSAKLDVTAYTPTDLSNYYTKSETSGATELSTAFSGKQDILIAGDNITISGNVISAAGGDLSNYYTKSEVDEMSEVAAQGINDLNTNKLDVTAYTPTDLSNYYTKSETSGKTEIQTALGTKQDILVSGTNIKTVNNESLVGSGNIDIQGGNNVVELTQAQYDALASKDPDTFYVITDATPADLSQYWTSAQTQSAITQSVSGKQDTLSAGTGIDITSNVISVTGGGGGGKAIEAGRGISITTGETADTVSFNLPISSGTGISSIIGNGIIGGSTNEASSQFATAFGVGNTANNYASFAIGGSNYTSGQYSFAGGSSSLAWGDTSFAFGYMARANGNHSIALGSYFPIAENTAEVAIGKANISRTGSTDADKTLFTVGNGTNQSNRHNAFEIRQNGDIYITSGGTDIKLQDNLGGGGSSINVVQTTGTSTGDVMSQDAVTTALGGKQDTLSAGTGIDITSNVISVTGGGGSSINVVQTTGTSTGDVMSQDAVTTALGSKLDASAYTPTDLSNYYTKSETSGATELNTAFSSKLDASAYTPTDLSNYYTKSETSGKTELDTAFASKQDTLTAGTGIDITSNIISVTGGGSSINVVQTTGTSTGDVMSQDAVTTALSGKQGTLVSGTNIKTINNESILGSGNITIQGGGGKAIEAGRGITVTTGETADTVSFNLPISAGTGTNSIRCGEGTNASGTCSFAIGGSGVNAKGVGSFAGGSYSEAKQTFSMAFGRYCVTNNYGEVALGFFNKSNGSSSAAGNSSANTLFSVGNGTNSASNTRHNAFEIRQNGDIYITSGGTDIKLQDNLGGGGSSVTVVQTTGTSTGDVMSQDAVTTALSGKADAADLGGLKLQQITQSAYDALTNKDASTLYVIVS